MLNSNDEGSFCHWVNFDRPDIYTHDGGDRGKVPERLASNPNSLPFRLQHVAIRLSRGDIWSAVICRTTLLKT